MRLIDADELREFWLESGENECIYDTNSMLDSIDDAPTIDLKDLQPHGKNMTQMHPSDEFICSVCGIVIQDLARYLPEDETYYEYEPNFCPNCGARMREEM